MNRIIKKIIPDYLLYLRHVLPAYYYDVKRYYIHSAYMSGYNNENKLISNIIERYHSIEKGLTMPNFRSGFGVKQLDKLITECIEYSNTYNSVNPQLVHAVGVIYEYESHHKKIEYKINQQTLILIDKLKLNFDNIKPTSQKVISGDEYFSKSKSDFKSFASSRASVRNYSDKSVDVNDLIEAVEIAQTAPSACNRQSTRVYIYKDKDKINKILKIQGGNRGFGHLSDKLIIITSSLNVWEFVGERYQSYVDGGIYALNLLYALHYKKIAGCILNCSISPKKDKVLRQICGIDNSENFIAMVSCGHPPEKFSNAYSKRYKSKEILKIIE